MATYVPGVPSYMPNWKPFTPDYKFLCSIDSLTDGTEMDVSGERIIKTTFNLITKAYLLPQYLSTIVSGKVANLKRFPTVSKIKFGMEGDATGEQILGESNLPSDLHGIGTVKK